MNHFYPYNSFESDPHLLAILLKEQRIDSVKVRELSILDVLKISPNAVKKQRSNLFEEEEEDNSIWPLPPLEGCPQELSHFLFAQILMNLLFKRPLITTSFTHKQKCD